MHSDSKAQNGWELGVRFGDRASVEACIPIGIAPRLKPAVYFYKDFGVATYFDWGFKLSEGPAVFFTNSRGFEAGHFGTTARFRFGGMIKFEKDF